jgi:hypothetical protein
VNARRSEQINSGTSGGSKRSGTRTTEEYKRSACEDVLCEVEDFYVCDGAVIREVKLDYFICNYYVQFRLVKREIKPTNNPNCVSQCPNKLQYQTQKISSGAVKVSINHETNKEFYLLGYNAV